MQKITKTITKFETNDGKEFDTKEEAMRYLKNEYNNAILNLVVFIRGITNDSKLVPEINYKIGMVSKIVDLKREISKEE